MSYLANYSDMLNAMNKKRNKYIREQRKEQTQGRTRDKVIDLTSYTGDDNPQQQQHQEIRPGPGETIRTHYNNDGSIKYRTIEGDDNITRTFRSKVTTKTLQKAGVKSKLVQDSNDNNIPMLMTVSENGKGPAVEIEDNYQKYNPEPMEDKILESTGATILHSEVVLTDAAGNRQTFVKRKDETDYY